jgi:hypothetical protein
MVSMHSPLASDDKAGLRNDESFSRELDDNCRAPGAALDADLRVFGLPREASLREIDQRYRELARRLHAGLAPGVDCSRIRLVNASYSRLRRLALTARERPGLGSS